MEQPDGYQLAELNVGRLKAPVGDPRVAEFIDNIERINGLGRRMPGFVWMMQGSDGPGNTASAIGNDPQYVPNLSVWDDVHSLERFVWGTVHKQFFQRRREWFEVLGDLHFVMWWVPEGHRPSLDEALERLEIYRENGNSHEAFGWSYLTEATMWRNNAAHKPDTETA